MHVRRHPQPLELSPDIKRRVPWFRRRLLEWFETNKRSFPWREPGRRPYEIVVAEILLQRTPAPTVARIYHAFMERFPSWSALAGATPADLRPLLEPLGLWQVRAGILARVAAAMIARGDTVPASRLELEQINGVGQYTSAAILLVVHGQDEPLLDANMARVLERYFGPRTFFDIRDDPYLHALARRVVHAPHSLEMNWAILDLAATICKAKRPLCGQCPLHATCQFARLARRRLRGSCGSALKV